MKKLLLSFILCFSCLFLVACDPDDDVSFKISITGIQGISDITVDAEKNTVSFNVGPEVTTFDLKGINTGYDTIEILPVENEKVLESSIVDLKDGVNEFSINFSGPINYLGKDITISEDWTLTINKLYSATLESISVYSWKTSYYVNESFETGKISLNYSDGNSYLADLKASMVTGFDTSKKGTYNVTISYSGKEVIVSVLVSELDANLKTISIYSWINEYSLNGKFKEGQLLLTYNDGSSNVIPLTQDMVTGFNTSVVGEFDVTITFGGKSVKTNIIVEDNNFEQTDERTESIVNLLVKTSIFVVYGVVESDDNYEDYYDAMYNDFYWSDENEKIYVELFNDANISDEQLKEAHVILDENLKNYRDIINDIYQLSSEEDAALKISNYLFNDWDNHVSVVEELTDLLSTSQLSSIIMYFLYFDYNDNDFSDYSFEEYKEYVSQFDNSDDIIDMMSKYYNIENNVNYGSESDWFTIMYSTKNIIKVFTNFEKEELKLVVDTLIVLNTNPSTVSTKNLTSTVNILGAITLELYDVLPDYQFVTELFDLLFNEELFYPKELVKVLALVCIDFTSDDMLELLDILNANTEYMMVEALSVLSGSIVENINLVYGNNFETELTKYLSNVSYIDINVAAEFSEDLYNFLTKLSTTKLTDTNKNQFNEDMYTLLSTITSFIDNPFYLNVYNSNYNTFMVEKGLTEAKFYSYINSISYFQYKDMQINLSSEICTTIDLNKQGIQYLTVNIEGNILQIPVYVYDSNIDLELVDFSASFNDSTTDGTVYLTPEGDITNLSYSTTERYLLINITYYDSDDNIYFNYYVNKWLYEYDYNNIEVIINDLSKGEQDGLLKVTLFGAESIYLPVTYYVCSINEVINTKVWCSHSSIYEGMFSESDLTFYSRNYYFSEDGTIKYTDSIKIDVTILTEINYHFEGTQKIKVLYNDNEYEVSIYVGSIARYFSDNIYGSGLSNYVEVDAELDDIYVRVYDDFPNSISLSYYYVIKFTDLLDYMDELGVEYKYSNFDTTKTGTNYIYLKLYNSTYSYYDVQIKYTVYSTESNSIYISSVKKLSSFNYYYDSYFISNTLSLVDCDDINSELDLQKYSITFTKSNAITSTTMNLADFVNNYNAKINIDIDNEVFVVQAFGEEFFININILRAVVPSSISVYGWGNAYYWQSTNKGYAFIFIEYCDAYTNDYYGFEVEMIELINLTNIDTSQSGYQTVDFIFYGLTLQIEIYIYRPYTINAIDFYDKVYTIGLSEIDNLVLEGYAYYNTDDQHYYGTNISVSNYTINNLESIDLTTIGYKNLEIIYNEKTYNVTLYVQNAEDYIYSLLSNSYNNKVLLNSNINTSTIIINEYITESMALRDYYCAYRGYYTVTVQNFIDYAETLGVDVSISSFNTSTVGMKNITFTIGSKTKTIYYAVVDHLHSSVIVPTTITSSYGELTSSDINEIINNTNLENYTLTYYSYEAYYSESTAYYQISLLELKVKYNAKFTEVDGKLYVTFLGNVFVF